MSKDINIKHIFSADEEDCLSLELMKAYQSGKLSAAEKNYVERHLLNCELCAAAYEGVQEMEADEVKAGAEAIAAAAWERVPKKEEKRRGAFVVISVAASIFLLVTVSYLIISNQNKTVNDGQLASNRDKFYKEIMKEQDSMVMDGIASADEPESEEEGGEIEKSQPEKDSPKLYRDDDLLKANNNEYNTTSGGNIKTKSTLDYGVGGGDFGGVKGETGKLLEGESKKPVNLNYDYVGRAETGEEDIATEFSDSKMEDVVVSGAMDNRNDLSGGVFEQPIEETMVMEDEEYDGDANAGYALDDVDARDMDKYYSAPTVSDYKSDNYKESKTLEQQSMAKGKNERDRKEDFKKSSKDDGVRAMSEEPADQRSAYQIGLEYYNQKAYAQAAAYLRSAAQQTPSNLNAHFYAGISFLNIDQPDAAIYHFDEIIKQKNSSLYEDALWYKSAALFKKGKDKEATALLRGIEQSEGRYKRKAKKILDEME